MHPPFTNADVRFVEKWVSGLSRKNQFTRFGGAQNALIVTVLKDAVLIEPMAIFKWLMPVNFNDLEHYVTKPSITRVEPGSSFGRDTVRLEFRARDVVPRTLELVLRKRQEFLGALQAAQ